MFSTSRVAALPAATSKVGAFISGPAIDWPSRGGEAPKSGRRRPPESQVTLLLHCLRQAGPAAPLLPPCRKVPPVPFPSWALASFHSSVPPGHGPPSFITSPLPRIACAPRLSLSFNSATYTKSPSSVPRNFRRSFHSPRCFGTLLLGFFFLNFHVCRDTSAPSTSNLPFVSHASTPLTRHNHQTNRANQAIGPFFLSSRV
ncbi:hypothetical protein VTJ04DRAFT_2421 [Mycothermus thermophilus]|uniref:uncharacterized protein n=1 Tax=Humicola insolens TaxID=85995 RepID=UPI0037445BF7